MQHQWTGVVKLSYPLFYVCKCKKYFHLQEFRKHLEVNKSFLELLQFDIMQIYYGIRDRLGNL